MPRRPEPSDRFEEVDESTAETGPDTDPEADAIYGLPDVRTDAVEEPDTDTPEPAA